MAASSESYEGWLTQKLLSLNPETDTDVFVSYITGILDEDTPDDEKKESLVDFVGQVVEDNQADVCDELMKKWAEFNGTKSSQQAGHAGELTDHLAHILEHQKIETVKPREQTAEERARKRAILAQYNEVESGGEDDNDHHGDAGDQAASGGDLLDFKNVNAEQVKRNEQDMREKSKQESDKKREKDKQDREAQKQKQKDRKETEKKRTQKGERRR